MEAGGEWIGPGGGCVVVLCRSSGRGLPVCWDRYPLPRRGIETSMAGYLSGEARRWRHARSAEKFSPMEAELRAVVDALAADVRIEFLRYFRALGYVAADGVS